MHEGLKAIGLFRRSFVPHCCKWLRVRDAGFVEEVEKEWEWKLGFEEGKKLGVKRKVGSLGFGFKFVFEFQIGCPVAVA